MSAVSRSSWSVGTSATQQSPVEVAGRLFVRYSLALVLGWVGALKYASYESKAIAPLIQNSPFMSWLYDIFSIRTFGAPLGTAEIIAAVLIALFPILPKLSILGSAFSTLVFLGTISFLFTTPGVTEAMTSGFPLLSGFPGQFLIKDLVLLAASVLTLGEAVTVVRLTSTSNLSAEPAAPVPVNG